MQSPAPEALHHVSNGPLSATVEPRGRSYTVVVALDDGQTEGITLNARYGMNEPPFHQTAVTRRGAIRLSERLLRTATRYERRLHERGPRR